MKLAIVVHSEREYQLAAGASVRVWLIPDSGSQELRQNKIPGGDQCCTTIHAMRNL